MDKQWPPAIEFTEWRQAPSSNGKTRYYCMGTDCKAPVVGYSAASSLNRHLIPIHKTQIYSSRSANNTPDKANGSGVSNGVDKQPPPGSRGQIDVIPPENEAPKGAKTETADRGKKNVPPPLNDRVEDAPSGEQLPKLRKQGRPPSSRRRVRFAKRGPNDDVAKNPLKNEQDKFANDDEVTGREDDALRGGPPAQQLKCTSSRAVGEVGWNTELFKQSQAIDIPIEGLSNVSFTSEATTGKCTQSFDATWFPSNKKADVQNIQPDNICHTPVISSEGYPRARFPIFGSSCKGELLGNPKKVGEQKLDGPWFDGFRQSVEEKAPDGIRKTFDFMEELERRERRDPLVDYSSDEELVERM